MCKLEKILSGAWDINKDDGEMAIPSWETVNGFLNSSDSTCNTTSSS